MDKILTLIIPTYNMEKYLRYCLDSLIVSDGMDVLEVLIVNDGSRDGSLAIAREYEREYPQTFRVIDKENGNYGSCVNRGLKEATGKYVKVLDADDSFDKGNLERFIVFLEGTDADLVLSDFEVVDTDRVVRKTIRYDLGDGILFDMDKVCGTDTFKNMQMHAVTYRRENLLSIRYCQTEGISYTDQQWIFIPMIAVRKVVRFDRPVYKYQVGRAGQTVNPSVKLKSASQVALCALGMVEAYERHKADIAGRPVCEYLYARMIPMVKDTYVAAWQLYGGGMKTLLESFDARLHELSEEIYEYIAKPEVSSFMGFRYIDYWRRHRELSPFVVQTVSKAYVLQLKLRQSLRKPDEMAVPVSF